MGEWRTSIETQYPWMRTHWLWIIWRLPPPIHTDKLVPGVLIDCRSRTRSALASASRMIEQLFGVLIIVI